MNYQFDPYEDGAEYMSFVDIRNPRKIQKIIVNRSAKEPPKEEISVDEALRQRLKR